MLTGATIGAGVRKSQDAAGSSLLLTEYLAFVLDHRKSDDVKLATVAFGVCPRRRSAGLVAASTVLHALLPLRLLETVLCKIGGVTMCAFISSRFFQNTIGSTCASSRSLDSSTFYFI